jgi:hypothetical protein
MSRVVIVAPEFSRQVRGIIFAEIRKWARRAKVPLPVDVLTARVVVDGYGEEWGAIGVPATEPDRIEGFHSEAGVLLILDESKGIGQDVYDALQGALSGLEDNRLLVTSTPGGIQGPFWRIWERGGDAWRLHHLSAEDSSNVSPEWCAERAREWGRGSPLYQARVEGKFADAGDGVLFPLSLLEAASSRELEPGAEVTLGVDVARSVAGDQNAIAVARGGKLERVITWRSADTMATVARVVTEVVRLNPRVIRVDESGVGAGVVDRLRQMRFPAEGVPFGGSPADPTRFLNRRAEMYWALRDAMEQGKVALPDDDELVADLSALTFTFDQRGKLRLDSKDDVRKRLGRSPDRADAVALALGAGLRNKLGGPWQTFRVAL